MYLALPSLLLAAWILRVTVSGLEPWQQTVSVPGLGATGIVLAAGVFYLTLVGITLWSVYAGEIEEGYQ